MVSMLIMMSTVSCTFCNCFRRDRETGKTGGKGDFFPLWDEKDRVCEETLPVEPVGLSLLHMITLLIKTRT